MPRRTEQQSDFASDQLQSLDRQGHEFGPAIAHSNIVTDHNTYKVALAYTCLRCGKTKWFGRWPRRDPAVVDHWVHWGDGIDSFCQEGGGDDDSQ